MLHAEAPWGYGPTMRARTKRFVGMLLVVGLLGNGCRPHSDPPRTEPEPTSLEKERGSDMSKLELKSSAFAQEGAIPSKYTCQGEDLSPPLAWTGAPRATKSFALIVDDPDAPDPARPKRTWVHWVLYDIPASTTALAEGASTNLPPGTKVGWNDWHKLGYGGPCPPIGRHRYFHKLYALDTTLDLESPTKTEVERAMASHILGRVELVGTYEKK